MQRDWARDDDLFDTSYVADPYAISDELAVRELHSADVGSCVGASFHFTVLIG